MRRELDVSIYIVLMCVFFNGYNYLFNLSGTIELLKTEPEFSIISEFSRNDKL